MNILAIDTSNYVLGVAVLQNGEVMGEFCTNVKKNHSIRLMPAIATLMNQLDMSPEELDKIIVANGPGSYTGVRIGVTTAKTMAWSLNIPIVGVSSLEALAHQGRLYNSYICPFFDARRKNVFTGLYKWENGQMNQVNNETNISMTDWLAQLEDRNADILFLSPHLSSFNKMIMDRLGEHAIIPEATYHITRPAHVAFAGIDKQPVDVHSLTPNYLRMAEAEAKWLETQREVR
ncbi:tRNA (adenosine(37)-N6)-threonylcarbamoyltransferase complex dimerization subunit type 1 TsaB [Virgibacillus sp. W0181]|uniref:tRNA (adenosine(37)-N6)-threonylcarbamoyltransferase complex dimerization subunit type 1 TsaB n=1 Tax=Virgibacillus sp. W0181 TaxID=3391581 RepID=UPI003F488FA8